MKKKILVAMLLGIMSVSLVGCNKQIVDLTYSYERAILSLPNGEVIEGKITSWKDYEGDQLQVKIDGKQYLIHSEDIVLISEQKGELRE